MADQGGKTLLGVGDVTALLRALTSALTTIYSDIAAMTAAAYGTAWAAITGALVVKAAAGRAVTLIVIAPGTAGAITLNDTNTIGGASAANEFFTMAWNNAAFTIGNRIALNWPCASGITVSAMTTGGQVALAYA